jgi:thiol-disulfide isomerase/thioredoxin
MYKKLLLPTIGITYMLLSTACVQKEFPSSINTTSIETPDYNTPQNITPIELTQNENNYQENSTLSISGKTHQLPTVQGDSITIIENGNIGFDFPQYRGKVIIFEIFGKDCEFCVEEMPIINRIKKEFPTQVEVIAIQGQDRMSPSTATNLLEEHHINYPIIEGEDATEVLTFLADTYAWRGILPYILLVKDGTTEYTFPDGGVGYQELKESVNSLL